MTQQAVLRLKPPEPPSAFAGAVLEGLAARPRVIPARFLYDHAGSELFERITHLPDYYPTRVETDLLHRHARQIVQLTGCGRAVVEFGAGAATKTPILLQAAAATAYVPIDISGDFLASAAHALAAAHPDLAVLPVSGDFTHRLALPQRVHALPKLGFFPGSTIGNFTHADAVDLLRGFRATLGEGAWLLIGLDTRKAPGLLLRAYDDPQGVTAAFNLNLLHRINRELGADIPVAGFAHQVRWNDAFGRIEMHLRARADLAFSVAEDRFAIAARETIHTENSYKYTDVEADLLARAAHWDPIAAWTDADRMFALHLWRALPDGLDP